ncbi:hypothetical protein EDB86DRAFT_2839043 [Lactarius hatsudake]|nr:hypothetical protein EDB86DRAFT_2839043 [Lactarius hatsudake]
MYNRMQVTLETYKWTGRSKECWITSWPIPIGTFSVIDTPTDDGWVGDSWSSLKHLRKGLREWLMANTRPIPIGTFSVIDTPTDDGWVGDIQSSLKHLSKGLSCGSRVVAVMVTWPSASFSRGQLVPLLRCGRVVVAPWSYHRAIVTPSLHHWSESCKSSCGLHHAVCRMHRHVGLTSEWWWWLAVRVHVWEWWWWASMEVGGGHGGQRHT